jgi:HK97 gp10 family phage protein
MPVAPAVTGGFLERYFGRNSTHPGGQGTIQFSRFGGWNKLNSRFRTAQRDDLLRKTLMPVVYKTAERVLQTARMLCPVDTGALRDSLKLTTEEVSRTYGHVMLIAGNVEDISNLNDRGFGSQFGSQRSKDSIYRQEASEHFWRTLPGRKKSAAEQNARALEAWNSGSQAKQYAGLGEVHRDANDIAISSNIPYAVWVEFGTSKMPARPFIRPAIQQFGKLTWADFQHYEGGPLALHDDGTFSNAPTDPHFNLGSRTWGGLSAGTEALRIVQ